MPEQRLQKARATLPADYQHPTSAADRWRRPNENAAERLTSTAYRITQAQLEADRRAKDERL
jgi:hypothetical protein